MNDIRFDKSKHIYHSSAFEEIIKDTIRFFNGTPVHRLPPPEAFTGKGVYALYYIGNNPYYTYLYERNRLGFVEPIYVGKAVPKGWRQSRVRSQDNVSTELFHRLGEHANSIGQAENLSLDDFHCRFMILENAESDLIGTVEAALIRTYTPVWNSCIDGFGNHDPGRGRYNQSRSDWDVLHPGRKWAAKCKGKAHTSEELEAKLRDYMKKEGRNDK